MSKVLASQTKMDEYERRSLLITLAYEVLRDMEAPAEDATDMTMLSDLSRAFFDKASVPANVEAVTPRARRKAPSAHALIPT
jgi:hypothetical protein